MRALVTRFRVNRRGASAVEFAIVVVPFLLFVFSILELGIVFIVNTGLNVGTSTLAKQIRTGQIQAPGLSATTSSGTQLDLADATKQLCNQIAIMSSATCQKQLQLDVRPLSSFQQTVSSSPVSGTTFNASSLCFYSGNAGDIVEMRAYYLYSFVNPMLAMFAKVSSYVSGGASSSGKYYLVQTVQVFKSESYTSATNTGAGC